MAGIPLAAVGLLLLVASPVFPVIPWYWGLAAFVAGYFLQFLGHKVEGNDVGEWAAIKSLLGLPCNSISPRWQVEQDEIHQRAAVLR